MGAGLLKAIAHFNDRGCSQDKKAVEYRGEVIVGYTRLRTLFSDSSILPLRQCHGQLLLRQVGIRAYPCPDATTPTIERKHGGKQQ